MRLAQLGADSGFEQIWVNDNIRYRNQMVVLTAIAAQVPIRLGTAIMVPYFHNPLDMADSFAALSELCEEREISIGIARGDLGQSPQHVQALKPIAMVSETTRLLRRALAGEEFPYSDFPFLTEFYRLNPKGKFTARLQAQNAIQILRRRQRAAVAAHVRPHHGRLDQLGNLYSHAQSRPARRHARHRRRRSESCRSRQTFTQSLRVERVDFGRIASAPWIFPGARSPTRSCNGKPWASRRKSTPRWASPESRC